MLEGEFEVAKKMLPIKDPEEHWDQMVGPDKVEADMSIRIDRNMIKRNTYINKKLSLFGRGSMIGEDDASNMRNYSYSCRCYS